MSVFSLDNGFSARREKKVSGHLFSTRRLISMRHLRRKNVIGQNQKEPEPKLHTPSSSPIYYEYQPFTWFSREFEHLTAVLFLDPLTVIE